MMVSGNVKNVFVGLKPTRVTFPLFEITKSKPMKFPEPLYTIFTKNKRFKKVDILEYNNYFKKEEHIIFEDITTGVKTIFNGCNQLIIFSSLRKTFSTHINEDYLFDSDSYKEIKKFHFDKVKELTPNSLDFILKP